MARRNEIIPEQLTLCGPLTSLTLWKRSNRVRLHVVIRRVDKTERDLGTGSFVLFVSDGDHGRVCDLETTVAARLAKAASVGTQEVLADVAEVEAVGELSSQCGHSRSAASDDDVDVGSCVVEIGVLE